MVIKRDIPTSIEMPLAKLWNYTRPELLYLSWAVMEIALITPVVMALMPWAHFWPPFQFAGWLLLLMLLPFNLARVLTLARIPLRKQQNIFLITFWVIIVITIRTLLHETDGIFDLSWISDIYVNATTTKNPFLVRDVSLFFLIALIWWRGVALSNRRVNIDGLGLHVRVSALIITPFAVWLSTLRLGFNSGPFFILFFMGALMAIAITRAEDIEKERTGKNYPMTPRWLAVILGTSVVIGTVAWIAAAVISGEGLPAVFLWLAPLWKAISFSVTVIFSTFIYVLLPLLKVVESIVLFFRNLPINLPQPDEAPPTSTNNDAELIEGINSVFNYIAAWAIPIVIILFFIITVFWVLIALTRYFSLRDLGESGEELLENIGQGNDGPTFTPMQKLLDRFGLMRRWHAASIRRLYRQMVRAATANGFPRDHTETPYEYLTTLNQAWPEGQDEVQLITHAFVRVRYGEVPETRAELEAIRTAWHTLERMPPPES